MADPIVRRGTAQGWSALAADPRALARILDGAPYPAWIQRIDEPGFPCVAINDAWAAAYGSTSLELIGTLASDTMPPDDWEAYEAVVREVVDRGAAVAQQFRTSGVAGERIYDMVLTPLLGDDGVITQIFGVSRDVTEATTSVQTSIDRLRAVFRSAHDATFLFAPDGTCLDANRAAADLLAVDAAELLGVDLKEFAPGGQAVLDELAELPAGAVLTDTIEVRRRDGTVRLAEYHLEAHVQPGVHLVMASDVTERAAAEAQLRESESRFRVLADSAPALIWTSGPDGSAATFNRGWLAFRGCTLEEELAQGVFAGIHPDDRERCTTVFQTALATQSRVLPDSAPPARRRRVPLAPQPRFAPDASRRHLPRLRRSERRRDRSGRSRGGIACRT